MKKNNVGGIFGGLAKMQQLVGGGILNIFIGKPALDEKYSNLRALLCNIILLTIGITLNIYTDIFWFTVFFGILGFGTSIVLSLVATEKDNTKNTSKSAYDNVHIFEYDFSVKDETFLVPKAGVHIKIIEIKENSIVGYFSNNQKYYQNSTGKEFEVGEKIILNSNYTNNVAFEIWIKSIDKINSKVKISIRQIGF